MTEPVSYLSQLPGGQVQVDDLVVELPSFTGEAKQLIEELVNELVDVKDPAGVMLAGLGLLGRARGKDVLLRDRQTQQVLRVDIWKVRR
jgi:hypothetical protein